MRELERQVMGLVERGRRQTREKTHPARLKAAAASEFVLETLGSLEDKKLLFFAHHQSMLDAVHGAVAAAKIATYRIDGAVPQHERAALVAAFQALPPSAPAVFLLSIQAAGQGLTLTAAATAVFGELRWVPGELLQAEDRCHRIGQAARSVNVFSGVL